MQANYDVQLEELAHALRAQNPDRTFVVDSGVVWCRCPESGTDYGVYSRTILSSKPILWCMNAEGTTSFVHRPIPTETPKEK